MEETATLCLSPLQFPAVPHKPGRWARRSLVHGWEEAVRSRGLQLSSART